MARAVTEGLRVWTKRPFFKNNPETAIELISHCKNNPSEYLRKSVGNALRDIIRTHKDLIIAETDTWDLNTKNIAFVHKLIFKDSSFHKA